MEVVQLVEGHNFHVDCISNFEWKSMKNLPKGQYLLFMETEWHSKLATFSCKIC
jgi:hypothetical protein